MSWRIKATLLLTTYSPSGRIYLWETSLKYAYRLILGSLLAASLAACGGGGETEVCAANNQSFSIDFEESRFSASVGSPTTIEATVFPESCLGDMTFAVRTGALPQGLALKDGSIEGTPSEAGTFTVQIAIVGVRGYQETSFADFLAPRSREITIDIR